MDEEKNEINIQDIQNAMDIVHENYLDTLSIVLSPQAMEDLNNLGSPKKEVTYKGKIYRKYGKYWWKQNGKSIFLKELIKELEKLLVLKEL